MLKCELRSDSDRPGFGCEGEACLYWRVVDEIGVADRLDRTGCAVQGLRLLEGGTGAVEWLLSVKRRMEAVSPL